MPTHSPRSWSSRARRFRPQPDLAVSALVTSVRSPRVTAARRLHKRALRERERAFLAEGPQAVREALASTNEVRELFVGRTYAARDASLVELARAHGITVHDVGDEVVAAISQTVTPQGLVAVCEMVDVTLSAATAIPLSLVVVLSNVRDPGNAGTILRTADAAGADAVVFTTESVDPYNAKCVRGTAGSLWHVPVVVGADLAEASTALRTAGMQVLAADGEAPDDLDALLDADALRAPTAWVFGNEAWGLTSEQRAVCDRTVRIPIHGKAESLNLAAAAAVCLYASARAQRAR
jgi:RNA methyltransferase, TrmH family